MPDVVCNTSPLQYLHQLGELHLLSTLAGTVFVPEAVVSELATGRELGIDLPDLDTLDWVVVRSPVSRAALQLVRDLGPGETEDLALAQESADAVAVLDDGLARQVAQNVGIRVIGTLGILLEAKRSGLLPAVEPLLDRLQALRFRVAPATRLAVLRLAGETSQ